MKYNPALDGLRALAVLAVVALHSQVPFLPGGYIGVDVFFVLSGYLITRLLDDSHPTLRAFYIRRLRRLTPALAAMVAVYLAVFYVVVPGYAHLADAGIALLYMSDYAQAYLARPDYLAHTWSLSVEEHFYLLWPIIYYRFRPSTRVLVFAFVAATLWRIIADVWAVTYFRFDTRLSGLILGCLIAHAPRDRWPAWPGLAVLGYLVAFLLWEEGSALGPGITMAELAAAVVILGTPPKWLGSPKLAYLGKLSYGIYLWHYPITRLLRDDYVWWVVLPITLVSSVALAALSYHTVESYFRKPQGASGQVIETGNPA